MKQHELIAIEGDVKKEVKRTQTDLYHLLQKSDLFFGLEKTYTPLDEEDEKLPAENKIVQRDVQETVRDFAKSTVNWLNVMMSKDVGNQVAKADIEIDGEVIVPNVPVLTLLSMETELNHIKAVLESIPTLPMDSEWHKNEASGNYFTTPVSTIRKKKVSKVLVHFQPTKEHPGKSESYPEDVPVGTWVTKHISTAVPERNKKALLERLAVLTYAVKKARERANSAEIPVRPEKVGFGEKMMDFLFKEFSK